MKCLADLTIPSSEFGRKIVNKRVAFFGVKMEMVPGEINNCKVFIESGIKSSSGVSIFYRDGSAFSFLMLMLFLLY